MSCQIRTVASISDIPNIRRYLFPTDDKRGSENWLQQCKLSVAPTGDVIVIGNERRMVVLTSKWDSSSNSSQYQIIYNGVLHDTDHIKAVLCLPIVGLSQSSHVGPDWTCIFIGYDSGYVRMYTEEGDLLLEEQFHNETIISMGCQSQHSPRPDISTELSPEEIYVHYKSNVCVLPGNSIFQILRNCRNQLARVKAKGNLLDFETPPIIPKKWGFQDQGTINDVAVVGLNLCSTFDHLMTASTCGGFDSKFRATPPQNTLVLAAGSKPFVGFHFALEGGAQPVLSDVAKAVVNKLKSALPSWLSGHNNEKVQAEKNKLVSMQLAEPMGCRFGLCDLRRSATNIILSPNRKLAAISDALGRVMLVDASRGVAIRMFKGYRDAQCSFIQVPDERKSKHRVGNRIALFLVVYSPKKATIDIFSTQQGAKISSFTATKSSRLVHINYGLMGFTTTSKSRFVCQFTTLLIESDGQIKDIMVPFHYALTEKNNKRSRDIHIYKKLRQIIKSGQFDDLEKLEECVISTCSELKTIEIKSQLMDFLASNRDIAVEIIIKCAMFFRDNLEDESEVVAVNKLKIFSNNLVHLLNFYQFIQSAKQSENDNDVDATLNLGAKAFSNLQRLLDVSTISGTSDNLELKVSFADINNFAISDFISVFDLTQDDSITVKTNLDDTNIFKAAEILFQNYVTHSVRNYVDLRNEVKTSMINVKDLFLLLVTYWVNKPLKMHVNLEREMYNFAQVTIALVKTATSVNDIIVEYSDTSHFWSEIREILGNSNRPFPALMAAILCKYVAHKVEHERDMEESTTSLEFDTMEVLSQENCQWDLLIGKLEDVSLLNIVLSSKPKVNDCSLPPLKHDRVDISLKYILQKGKGSVSELVAQWLSLKGINPQSIVINDYLYKTKSLECDNADDDAEFPEEQIIKVKEEDVFQHLNLIKVQFPYCLDASMLLANMSWEYGLEWKNNIKNITTLEACIQCLETVPDIHIRKGLYNLLWNTHLKILFESSTKLLNKVGKLPKERLCQQDTGLSDDQIRLFLGLCTNFLDKFTDVVQQCCGLPDVVLKFEPIWDNNETQNQPLVELALQQNNINYDLLHVHYQLCLVLQMMCCLGVKQTKILTNLFDVLVVSDFFTDFQKVSSINYYKFDTKILGCRTQFLLKVISASIDTISSTSDSPSYTSSHVFWMSQCVNLGRIWSLDLDVLRRHQVVQLFSHGCNDLGQELLSSINGKHDLGVELLAVAGKRLSNFIAGSSELGENLTALTPTLTKYLDTLNGDWCAPSSLEDLSTLATISLSCLDEKEPEHKLALLLFEACASLTDLSTQVRDNC